MERLRLIGRLGLGLGFAYALVWGFTWLTGDRSYGTFGWSDSGGEFHTYPGVFMGGLPPLPWPQSDAPQAIAAVVGAIGLVWVTIGWRSRDIQ
jgi:hypothetical protein